MPVTALETSSSCLDTTDPRIINPCGLPQEPPPGNSRHCSTTSYRVVLPQQAPPSNQFQEQEQEPSRAKERVREI